MKKVFQTKLKNITKVLALVIVASLATFTGCKSYDADITGLQTQIDAVVTDVKTLKDQITALQASVNGMTYIKTITLGADGKLTITPSAGNAIVYDAKSYVTYDISLTNNVLTVNGVNKGTVVIPALTFGADGKLMSGTTVVADLTSWLKSGLTLGTDNYLYINGQKTTVLIPAVYVAPTAAVTVKSVALSGNTITFTYTDGTTKDYTPAATAIVVTTGANGHLLINGIDSGVMVTNTYGVANGFLTVNGVPTTVAIPAAVVPGKTVKDVALVGTNVVVTYTDNTTSTFAVATAGKTVKDVALVGTNVVVTYTDNTTTTFANTGAENKNLLVFGKDPNGNIITTTIMDGNGNTLTIKVNPANESLAGLLFIPSIIQNGVNLVELGYIMDIPTAPAVSVKAMFTTQNVRFRLNPTSADLTNTTWKFLNNQVEIRNLAPGARRAAGDVYTLFTAPTGTMVTNTNDGAMTFQLKVNAWSEPTAPNSNLFALEANGKDAFSGVANKVVSDYVKVNSVLYNAFISNAKLWLPAIPNTFTHYRPIAPATAKPLIGDVEDFQLVKDNSNAPDLDDLVFATATNSVGPLVEKKFADYGFGTVNVDYKFEFSISDIYLGLDGVTNQNSSTFVTLDPVTHVLSVTQGSSVLDRRPLVTVKLKTMAGNLLATAYIKFKIVDQIVPPPVVHTVTYIVPQPADFTYPSLFVDAVAGVSAGDYKEIIVTWPQMNTGIYNAVGLSHNEYQSIYGGISPTVAVKVNGVAVVGATLAQYPLIRSILAPDVDSYAMKYQVTPLAKFGLTEITYTFNTGVIADAIVVIKFSFNVLKPTLDKTILAGYQYPTGNTTNVMTQGMNTGGGYLMQIYLGEAFNYGSPAYRAVFGTATAGKIDGATHQFVFQTTVPAQSGAALSVVVPTTIDATYGTTSATGTLMTLTTPMTTAERIYAMDLQTTYPNGQFDDFLYNVHFVNPFTIVLATPNNFTLIDLLNGSAYDLNLVSNYNVLFRGKNIVTGGVLETTNTATTVKASDYAVTANLTYTYANLAGNPYILLNQPNGAGTSVLRWQNAGTQLTSTVQVGTVGVTFVAPFAAITRPADNVYVRPE